MGYGLKWVVIELQNCINEFRINIPAFYGLSTPQIINTTCQGCLDGQIIPQVNSGAPCEDCEFGSVIILDESLNDVTDKNDAGELPAGTYYVVVLDANTGCFIAHREVTVE